MLFLLPKCQLSDDIQAINSGQLLVIMEDVLLYHELKDKLEKVD
jgi:hypothetical protein